MMPNIKDLVILTITDPARAARDILSMNIPSEAGWTALLAVSAFNAFIFGLGDLLTPEPPDGMVLFTLTPMAFFGLLVPALAMLVYAMYWAGRGLGGTGSLPEILTLMTWLQFVNALVRIAAVVMQLIIPVFAALLVFVAMVWGLWITANFVDQGHRLNSPLKAFGVMLAAGLGIVLALSFLITLFVGPSVGV
ncbi:MAG: YIP1 family protein [Rhodobacteraceae bacterium]|nr:YIP1 family protein [Paracoccaceae bacterium]